MSPVLSPLAITVVVVQRDVPLAHQSSRDAQSM